MKRSKSKPQNASAPVTQAQFNEGMQMIANAFEKVATKDELKRFATKDDLKRFATKDDLKQVQQELKQFATKDDLKQFATKDDLKQFATKDDLKRFATKDDLKRFATKDDLKRFATKDDLKQVIKQMHELHQKTLDHFDAVAENIHADLAGANKDEISVIQDTQVKHEQRIMKIENHLEITPAV